MSQFTAPLLVTPLSDGKSWVIVTGDFTYDVGHEGSEDSVRVPRGMVTDFASVPRPVWWFAAPWGTHGHAAVIHDAGYYLQDRSRRDNDRIFLEAMEVLGVGKLKRTLLYLAVRWFGSRAWSTNASRNRKRPDWKIVDPVTLGLPASAAVEAVSLVHDRATAPAVRELREAVDAARRA
jgi:hypothetical protein